LYDQVGDTAGIVCFTGSSFVLFNPNLLRGVPTVLNSKSGIIFIVVAYHCYL
jgi:energy-converting hydrogenase Eha subunit C